MLHSFTDVNACAYWWLALIFSNLAPKGIFLLMSEDKTIETWQRLKDCSTFSLKSIPLRHLNWKFSQSPQAES